MFKICSVDPKNEKSGIGPILAILTFNCSGSKTLAAQVLHLAGVATLTLGIAALGDGAAGGFLAPGGAFTVASLDFHGLFPKSVMWRRLCSIRIVKISQEQEFFKSLLKRKGSDARASSLK